MTGPRRAAALTPNKQPQTATLPEYSLSDWRSQWSEFTGALDETRGHISSLRDYIDRVRRQVAQLN